VYVLETGINSARSEHLMRTAVTNEEALELEWIGKWTDAAAAYRALVTEGQGPVKCRALIRLARCLLETCKRGETDEAEALLAEAGRLVVDLKDVDIG